MAVQDDGKIVIVGTWVNAAPDFVFFAARFATTMSLDPTFNAAGPTPGVKDVRETAAGSAVAVRPNGRIVAGGSAVDTPDFLAAQLLPNGTPDPSFGTSGLKPVDFPGAELLILDDLALQENGQAVLAGTVRGNADSDFAVARLNGDGSLDQRFHGDGRVAVDFGVNELGQAVALQTNGKIVVGGGGPRALIIGTPPVKERSFLLARLQGCTISGTNGDDILAGTDGNDVICRLSGNDVLTGKSGNDLLIGGYGADTMSGGGEADTLRGGPGNDALSGGPGNDLVIGETGKDGLKGNDGNDTLDAVDGLGGETVNGGGGTDQCTADPGDQVSNCE